MTDVAAVYKQLRAYKQSRLLAVALHHGVLQKFSGKSQSVEIMAQTAGWQVPWLRPLLGVLVDLSLLSYNEGQYKLTDLGRAVNTDNALNAFAGYHYHCYSAWSSLPEALESGAAGAYHSKAEQDPDFCISYLKSLDEIAKHNLLFLKEYCQPLLSGCVLDVGCGPATLLRFLAQEVVSIHADALDLPPISAAAENLFETPQRFRWISGDLWDWTPDQAYDILLCSHLLEYAGIDKIRPMLKRLKSFVSPGGVILLTLFVRSDVVEPDLDLFEISTGLNGQQMGHIFSVEEFKTILNDSGLPPIDVKELPRGPSYREALFHCRV